MSVPFLTKSIKTKLKVQCQGVYATQIVHLTGIKRNNFIVFITKKQILCLDTNYIIYCILKNS